MGEGWAVGLVLLGGEVEGLVLAPSRGSFTVLGSVVLDCLILLLVRELVAVRSMMMLLEYWILYDLLV